MATRRDVAQRAGVSVATVSYVMNDTKNVTPEVRERVMRAVDELDYRPNLLARGLSTRETRHVAMLVDNLSNPHYCEVLSGAQEVASKNGYIVSVISVDFSNTRDVLFWRCPRPTSRLNRCCRRLCRSSITMCRSPSITDAPSTI